MNPTLLFWGDKDGQRTEAMTVKFFVYIIESPSAPDLYLGRTEGEMVAKAVKLNATPVVTRTAINSEAFVAALTVGLSEDMKGFHEHVPIVHISAHGSVDGIQLSSGENLAWTEIRELLIPINQSLGGLLVLCMSACEGYFACTMAKRAGDDPHPFFAMVGNYEKPTWSETAVAYSSFYHLLCKGKNIFEAVEGMKAASGNTSWIVETAEESKRSFLEYLQKIEPDQAQQALEEVTEVAASESNRDAKAFLAPA